MVLVKLCKYYVAYCHFAYNKNIDWGNDLPYCSISMMCNKKNTQDDLIIFMELHAMAWIVLILAGVFEIVWAYSMKLSEGFTKLTPSIVTIVFMILSFGLLAYAMRTLPLGTAYTIWTGIGAVGSFLVGIFILAEPVTAMRVLAALLIVAGLVLMKLSSS